MQGESLLEQTVHKNPRGVARKTRGRNACGVFLIIDAQRVKNSAMSGQKGYNADKKSRARYEL